MPMPPPPPPPSDPTPPKKRPRLRPHTGFPRKNLRIVRRERVPRAAVLALPKHDALVPRHGVDEARRPPAARLAREHDDELFSDK
jgi:hypothetical protein